MRYPYEDLSASGFEELVVLICQKLLGMAVKKYSAGRDGGIDAKFEGTANCFPSESSPWRGITIIQAKHTNGRNKSFSEGEMFGNKGSIITKEVKKIKNIHANGGIDNYIFFANRKLTPAREIEITKFICNECGIPNLNVSLVGVELIETYTKNYPDIPNQIGLEVFGGPLIFNPEDLDHVVEALAAASVKELAAKAIKDSRASNLSHPTERTSYEEKNILNNVSEEYAKNLRKKYLQYASEIKSFFANPENESIREKYETVANDYQAKILAYQPSEVEFSKVIETIIDHVIERDIDLKRERQLTRAVIFYMYWNCDIGRTHDDVEAE